jgi:hypothetical protein
MALIISADEIKKELANYSPDKAEDFHRESAKKADKLFVKALKEDFHKEVILLSGGTASGKTEFLATQLYNRDNPIMDATLSTELGAKNKIRQIIKEEKSPIIYFVMPDDLNRAFIAFLNRERKFSNTHFYKTHAGSRSTLLWIVEHYSDITIHIIESAYDAIGTIQFDEVRFKSKKELITHIHGFQITESDIIASVNRKDK